MDITVENIKCGGCVSGIRKALVALPEVEQVSVDTQSGQLTIQLADGIEQNAQQDDHSLEKIRQSICQQLLKMGYPEKGSVHGLTSAGAKAKSFVSCAVGKMNSET